MNFVVLFESSRWFLKACPSNTLMKAMTKWLFRRAGKILLFCREHWQCSTHLWVVSFSEDDLISVAIPYVHCCDENDRAVSIMLVAAKACCFCAINDAQHVNDVWTVQQVYV